MVDVIHHQSPAQKLRHDVPVPRISLHQRMRKANDSLLLQRLFLMKLLGIFHCRQRQERHPSETVLLQIGNQPFGRLLILRHHVLNTASQCGFDGCLILFLRLDQICDHAADPFLALLLLHDPADAVSVSVVPFRQIPERFQPGCFSVVCGLSVLQTLPADGDLLLKLLNPVFRLFPLRGFLLKLRLNSEQFLLLLFQKLILAKLRALHLDQLLIHFCLPDLNLLRHGVIALDLSLDGRSLVQKRDDLILAVLHVGLAVLDPLLDHLQRFRRFLLHLPGL